MKSESARGVVPRVVRAGIGHLYPLGGVGWGGLEEKDGEGKKCLDPHPGQVALWDPELFY